MSGRQAKLERRRRQAAATGLGIPESELDHLPLLDVATQDQVGAAARDVEEMIRTLVALGGYHHDPDPDGERGLTLIEEAIRRWVAAGRPICKHLDKPQPTFLSLCTAAMLCARCTAELELLIQGTDEDNRCDRCGRLVEPTGNNMFPKLATVGALTISAGCCEACNTAILFGASWSTDCAA